MAGGRDAVRTRPKWRLVIWARPAFGRQPPPCVCTLRRARPPATERVCSLRRARAQPACLRVRRAHCG
eukprot:6841860-Prymnesium_polylepis.1